MPTLVDSIAVTLLSLSIIQAHLMYLGENLEAVDSLKNHREYLSKQKIEEFQTKQTSTYYYFFPVNQLTQR